MPHSDGRTHAGLRTFEHESGPPDASGVAKAFVRMHDVFVDFTVDCGAIWRPRAERAISDGLERGT